MPPQPPPRYEPGQFDEVGFTQGDRDALQKMVWTTQMVLDRMEKMDIRIDASATAKEVADLKLCLNHTQDDVLGLRLKYAAVGGIIAFLAFVEPVFIKLFWH